MAIETLFIFIAYRYVWSDFFLIGEITLILVRVYLYLHAQCASYK